MENLKHTPGPWYVINDFIYRRPKNELFEYGGTIAGDKPLAFVNKGWDEEGYPVEANARLIAAAPELLEAIYILLEDNGYDITLPIEGFSHRTQKVIEAIQKATL